MGNGSGHKNTSKSVFKSVWFWLVLVVLVVSGVSMAAGQSSDSTSESQTAAYQSEDEEDDYYDDDEDEVEADEYSSSYATSSSESDDIDDKIDRLVKSGKAFEAKDYIAGKIPAGEYAFVTDKYSSGKYYSEDDAAGEIIDNENFSSFGYVQVHSTENLTTDGLLVNVDSLGELGVVGAKDLYEKLNLLLC
ncbi:hypothetical protein EFL45_10130 [Weissella confusa]|uniref:hypothetical protein n=1 Tax=Weissella confusa TaxID=1583 RepID=UPI00223AB3D9|nr:hypothetical protein [Weissella confusa]MCT0949743.1 hypothetical protein [Weissella confusa]